MSYARNGVEGSDVYIYMGEDGYLCCCFCSLQSASYHAHSTQEMVDHLARHEQQGDNVPEHVVPCLWIDDEENFPPMGTVVWEIPYE